MGEYMKAEKKNILHQSQSLEGEVLSKATIRVAHKLDLTQKELSEILGASKSEISRLFNKQSYLSVNSNEGQRAVLLIRIYRDLDSLFGEDERQSQEWFKNINHHLDGIPLELSKSITGLVDVLKYLDAMRGMA